MWFIVTGCAILALCLSWWISGNRSYRKGFTAGVESVKADTVTKIDTHYVDRPVPVLEYRDTGRLVYVQVTDTTNIHDTTFIVLPTTVRQYADSTYRLQVSGVQPQLDWIETYTKTNIVNHYFPQLPEVTITPSVKLYVTPAGFDAAAMIRVTKWWDHWRFDGGAGYGIHLGAEQKPGWYAEIGFGYDIIRH